MSEEKVGLKIVELIHSITQEGYNVKFASDFEGMVRIDLTQEWNNEFYEHEHVGVPGQERKHLEKGIINALARFLYETIEERKNADRADDR